MTRHILPCPVVVGNGMSGQQPILVSGLQNVSTIVVPDLEFEGGILHIVDTFLTIPPNISDTLAPLGLTAAQGALTTATNLGSQLPKTTLTFFVPSNAAFEDVGSVLDAMSQAQLSNVMGYHIVPGVVTYLDPFRNVSLPTLISKDVHIVGEDGKVFVNSAEAVVHNILVAEGVMHVIDNVLNPKNATALHAHAAATPAPAFSGATPLPGNVVPFTSGLSPFATSVVSSSSISPGGLTTGVKAGIGIAVALGAVFATALGVFCLLPRLRRASFPLSTERFATLPLK